MSELARILEALLFLAGEPVGLDELSEATGESAALVGEALAELAAEYEPGRRGLLLRELAGGYTLASDPLAEDAARALLAKPDWLFLDEATAALDEANEAALYRALAEHLPQTTVVSIGHRSTLAAFHKRRVELTPDSDGTFAAREADAAKAAE